MTGYESGHPIETAPRMPVVILLSGRGSNMCAIADLARSGALPIEVRAVISDRADAAGLERARDRQIPTRSLSLRDFSSRDAFDAALAQLVDSFEPKLVILAGYMKILGGAFVRQFAGRLLNIHPSLLPQYPGLHTHRRALEARDSVHGASVHFVTETLDGGPVIVQGRIKVDPSDTELSLAARVHQAEHMIYPQAIHLFASGRVALRSGHLRMDDREPAEPIVVEFPS